ncbi:glycosyl transferase family 1 [Prevotella pectinovora]|uniref:glycosyltransferase family 4 protein n=1 Tax=Prevotella pectinovora TaxID=1602169 RepID=UPI0005B6F916|nr:glycosyltransferase [Prevotella pectinovora]KIP55967.1 glycosyl transferase family 1 [Prevotella pectinovora]
MKILINAYACSPGMGSEPGMAWNWVSNLAKFCELHIITEGEFREKIETVVPTLEQGGNMHFYYNPVSEKIRKMCWNQGDWRFYKYYREWQWKTYLLAKDICSKEQIDILHQLNMIGFREPGYLWQLSRENGVPFVWGPVDAKDKFPVAYLDGAGLKTKLFMRLKNFLTGIQLRYSKRVLLAARQSSVIFSASSNSQRSFKKYMNIDSPLLNETGCYVQDHPIVDKTDKETFDVLWVGKMDFRKQLALALQTVAKSENNKLRLHIMGGGDAESYQSLAKSYGIADKCIWHGAVSHDEVQDIMQKSDIFLFTSVAEGTPHVVLEAISNNLPVVCFDTCGQGDAVNDKVGRKIPLSSPCQSVSDFAKLLNELEDNRSLLKQLSENCKERQQELSWEEKAKTMMEWYEKILRK